MNREKEYRNVTTMGYPVFCGDLEDIKVKDAVLVSTINQYSYCIAERDVAFKQALMDSDVLLPDGVGITFASKFLNGREIKKIAGADIHSFLLQKLNRENGSCFYLGAMESTLKLIRERVQREYPNVKVGSFSPAFKPSFSKEDTAAMQKAVNQFKPQVLFVGMTAPKQEKWAFENKDHLEVGLICSIGAVFDFYAGTVKRPGKIWITLGLEWLGRLVREPKRMWKRYIYYGFVFMWALVKKKAKTLGNKTKEI
ncbi:WecB/TagA/CpsF family glycosyltransferase [Maribacter sp. 2307ULW6-5]|uniref:WecB/TagA/CpsF family glycosyltransferase n=1 Tax=Maribacter sp. 2307ULW6-5 TaxID=3386275 RepID=UPI0039BCD5C1